MPDIIIAILISIFLIGEGAYIGYDFCKKSKQGDRYGLCEELSNKDRLIGNDDLALIGADIVTFAWHENADKRKAERKAYIALCRASKVYSFMTDTEVEESAGKFFDERMAYYDARMEETENA